MLGGLRRKARAAVRNGDLDLAVRVHARAQHHFPTVLGRLGHRVDRVAHEIQHHLLQLDRIGVDRRQRLLAFESQADVVQACVGLGQRAQVLEQARAVDRLALDLAVLDEVAQPPDHLAGPQRLRVDLLERGEHVAGVRLGLRHQALAGPCVGRDRGQRLVDLVREARGHLAHGREPAEVRQALLQHARVVLGAAPVGDVVDGADVLHDAAVVVEHGLCEVMEVSDRPVAKHDLVLDVERRLARVHAHERLRDPLAVGRVHPALEVLLANDGRIAGIDAKDAVQLR